MSGLLAVISEGPEGAAIEDCLRRCGIEFLRTDASRGRELLDDNPFVALLVDEAAMAGAGWTALNEMLSGNAAASTLPVILLARRASAPSLTPRLRHSANLAFVETPVDEFLLDQAVRGAIAAGRAASEATQINDRLRDEIEARESLERRLRESEDLYRRTIELTNQLAWTASADLRLESVSRGLARVTSRKTRDLHRAWLNIVHPDDRAALIAKLTTALGARTVCEVTFRMRAPSGSYRCFRARAAPRIDPSGKLLHWYGFAEDIQDRLDNETARREAEERYQLAARATNDAIWELVPSADVIRWAQTAGPALGYDSEVGETDTAWWSDRIHPDDRAFATSSLETAIQGSAERWSTSYRFRDAGGGYRRYVDRGFIVRDENGVALRVVGAMTDVTEQQIAHEELGRMQAELIHVSRMSAMGTMASTLAHELNQPLTVVTNYLRGIRRLIEADQFDLDELRHALMLAESGALRAGQIVRRLRELVARGTAAMRAEELPKLIEDAGVIAFLDAHLVGVVPQVELDPRARWVEADRIQVQQVIINLTRNAIQAVKTAESHEIVIRTRRLTADFAQIDIEDSGGGISPAVREALFSPFHTTKADGMGIGLSISRTIVEAHGGKIWASDRPGGGTIFSFTLPALDEPN